MFLGSTYRLPEYNNNVGSKRFPSTYMVGELTESNTGSHFTSRETIHHNIDRCKSKNMGGGHLADQTISGIWSPTESCLHINALEMKAVISTLKHFTPLIRLLEQNIAMVKVSSSLQESYSKSLSFFSGTTEPCIRHNKSKILIMSDNTTVVSHI